MKRMLIFIIVLVNFFPVCQAQSVEETTVAIEEFVSHISNYANSSQRLYFYVTFLPDTFLHNLPTKVSNYYCIYFSTENKEKGFKKMLRKKDKGRFYTIEVQSTSQDTIDFLFSKVDIQRNQGDYEVFGECRGTLPTTPDVRIINSPNGERIIQSSIVEISKRGIDRTNVLQ